MTGAITARRQPLQCGHVPGTGWVCGSEPAGVHPHGRVPSSSTALAVEGAVRGPGPPLLLPVLLNALPHPNMYVLERVQHRVPEEALRVSAARPGPAPGTPFPLLVPEASWLPGRGAVSQPGLACSAGWPGLASGEIATPLPPSPAVTQPQRRAWREPERRFLGPAGGGVRKRTHHPGISSTRRTLLLGGGRQGWVARGWQRAALGKVLGGGALRHTSVSWGWGMGVTAGGAPTFLLVSCVGVKERTQGTLCTPQPRSPDRSWGRLTPIFQRNCGQCRESGWPAQRPMTSEGQGPQ